MAVLKYEHREREYPLAVVGVDPGGTTGIAEYVLSSADTLPQIRHVEQLTDPGTVYLYLLDRAANFRAAGYHVVFVIEQFDNRPGIVDPDFTPKYIINDVWRFMADEDIVWQTPSQAKNLVKPGKSGVPDGLKRFGWFTRGKQHANDASRHVIVFLVERLKHMPTILQGWPRG